MSSQEARRQRKIPASLSENRDLKKGRTTPLYFAPLTFTAFCLSDFGQTIYIYIGNFYISNGRKIW